MWHRLTASEEKRQELVHKQVNTGRGEKGHGVKEGGRYLLDRAWVEEEQRT